MMMKIYLNIADWGACSYYRTRLPYRHCVNELEAEGISLTCSETLDPDDEHDVYYFHYTRLLHPHVVDLIQRLKARGAKVIAGLDDDIWHVPDWNPARFTQKQISQLNKVLDKCSEIWVSTSELARVVWQKNTVVLPNLIDLDDWQSPRGTGSPLGQTRIVWAGSVHHEKDLEEITDAVERLIRKYGPSVQFFFFGFFPDKLSKWVRVQHTNIATAIPRDDLRGSLCYIDPVDLSQYPATLRALGADIGLCPLADAKFNNSKSNIKFLEYTAAGMATVASAMTPYWDAPRKVFQRDWWYSAIRELIEIGGVPPLHDQALRLVQCEYSWQSPMKKLWLDAFRRLA